MIPDALWHIIIMIIIIFRFRHGLKHGFGPRVYGNPKMLLIIIPVLLLVVLSGCSSGTENHFAPDGSHRVVVYGDENEPKTQLTLARFSKAGILHRHVKTNTDQGKEEYTARKQQTGFRGNGFPVVEIDKNMPQWCNAATGAVPSDKSVATIKKFLSEPREVCYRIPYLWKVPCSS